MRKIALSLLAVVALAIHSFAQTSVELIPTAGYTFASRTDFVNYYGHIQDGLNLGGSIKFNINRGTGIEVLYNHMSTTSGLYQYGPGQVQLTGNNLKLDYAMIGPVQSFNIPNSTVRPFIGFLLGAAIFTPDANSGYSSETKFAMGFQLGTNIYFSPRVGIQLKAQLLSAVDGAGGSFYFSNYGSGAGIDAYSAVYQFSLSGGLIIGLGRVLQEQVYRRPARRPGPRHYRYYY
jgi:hypothetical protein